MVDEEKRICNHNDTPGRVKKFSDQRRINKIALQMELRISLFDSRGNREPRYCIVVDILICFPTHVSRERCPVPRNHGPPPAKAARASLYSQTRLCLIVTDRTTRFLRRQQGENGQEPNHEQE
ncbi:hypothetical protein J6590_069293 [Homalodisca vitripennis]|nr:hypothetical protein J6590_069293 [Homalodisca vitripennis]